MTTSCSSLPTRLDGFGLFSFQLAAAGAAAPVYAESAAVDQGADGARLEQASVDLPAGQAVLTLTDFEFPGPLPALAARGSCTVRTSSRRSTMRAPRRSPRHAGAYQLYVYARADAAAGSGTFGAELSGSAGSVAQTVDVASFAPAAGAPAATERSFDIDSSGTYALTLTDFEFPLPFAALSIALLRGTEVVATANGGATLDFDATPGTYTAAIVAEPTGDDGTGLLGLRVTDAVRCARLRGHAGARYFVRHFRPDGHRGRQARPDTDRRRVSRALQLAGVGVDAGHAARRLRVRRRQAHLRCRPGRLRHQRAGRAGCDAAGRRLRCHRCDHAGGYRWRWRRRRQWRRRRRRRRRQWRRRRGAVIVDAECARGRSVDAPAPAPAPTQACGVRRGAIRRRRVRAAGCARGSTSARRGSRT